MPYKSDYVQRLIEQLGELIRRTMAKLSNETVEETGEIAGQAIGLALGMDPTVASRLSSQSLVSLLELSGLDAGVLRLVAQAIELEADLLQRCGEKTRAEVRREQATMVRSLAEPET
jgi:hypothetical protein